MQPNDMCWLENDSKKVIRTMSYTCYLECDMFTRNRSLSQLKVQVQKHGTAVTAIQGEAWTAQSV